MRIYTASIVSYPATWTYIEDSTAPAWAIYDSSEGFAPAYAIVWTSEIGDAAEIAEEISNGRLSENSETLMIESVTVTEEWVRRAG